MGRTIVIALKVVIALSLAGSLIVQVLILPAVWNDLAEAGTPLWGSISLVAIAAAGVATMQVFAICVWRLLTLVRRGSVFSPASFRYLDVITGAFGAGSLLALALAVLLAPGGIAPGIVGLICGASLVLAGVTLLVLVVRRLLAQAIARETENYELRSELDEVV